MELEKWYNGEKLIIVILESEGLKIKPLYFPVMSESDVQTNHVMPANLYSLFYLNGRMLTSLITIFLQKRKRKAKMLFLKFLCLFSSVILPLGLVSNKIRHYFQLCTLFFGVFFLSFSGFLFIITALSFNSSCNNIKCNMKENSNNPKEQKVIIY